MIDYWRFGGVVVRVPASWDAFVFEGVRYQRIGSGFCRVLTDEA